MYLIQPQLQSRRAFLRRAGQLAFTGAALPTAINLAALGEAAAFSNPSDYKALVCVFLYGGNDYGNTLVPYDSPHYNAYAGLRGGLAIVIDRQAHHQVIAHREPRRGQVQLVAIDPLARIAFARQRHRARADRDVFAAALRQRDAQLRRTQAEVIARRILVHQLAGVGVAGQKFAVVQALLDELVDQRQQQGTIGALKAQLGHFNR